MPFEGYIFHELNLNIKAHRKFTSGVYAQGSERRKTNVSEVVSLFQLKPTLYPARTERNIKFADG